MIEYVYAAMARGFGELVARALVAITHRWPRLFLENWEGLL